MIFLRKAHTWASGVFCTRPLSLTTKGSAGHLLLTRWTFSQNFTCWVGRFLDVKRSNVWSLLPTLWLCCHIQEVIVLYFCIISCSCLHLSHGISGDSFHTEVNQNHFYRIWPKGTGWATWIIGNQICVCLCRSSDWHWESKIICCSKTISEWICSMACHRSLDDKIMPGIWASPTMPELLLHHHEWVWACSKNKGGSVEKEAI